MISRKEMIKEKGAYEHKSGLIFSVGRLLDADENKSYDICVIIISQLDNPDILVNYYYGEPNTNDTKYYADEWISKKSEQEIKNYIYMII